MKLHTLTMAVALGMVTAPAFAATDVDALEKRINELEQRLEQTEKHPQKQMRKPQALSFMATLVPGY